MLLAGTRDGEDAPPGVTSDSAKDVRLSADGHRGRGDRREVLAPVPLIRAFSGVPCDALEGLRPSGAAEGLVASSEVSRVPLEG